MAFIDMDRKQKNNFINYCLSRGWKVQELSESRLKIYFSRNRAVVCRTAAELYMLCNA